MITIQEIHEYLYRLTPQDEYYKNFFLEKGRLLSVEELRSYWKKNPLPELSSSPLSFLNPAYHSNSEINAAYPDSVAFSPLNPKLKIRNSQYFSNWEGISIRKHSNYFPSFRHTHSFMEICYVIKGQCVHQFYSEPLLRIPSDTITMCENDLVLIPPGIYHTIKSSEDAVIINILVKPGAIEKIISQFMTDDVPLFVYFAKILYGNKLSSFLLFRLGKNEFLESLLDRLLLEYCNRQPIYPQIMNQILGLYFSIIQRNYGNEIEISQTAPSGADHIPPFLLYLQTHYTHFSMEEMASHFRLSSSYISRVFRANTGSTVINTVMGMRLETAKNMLKNSSHPVNDIAEYVGYEDTTYFIRIFRKKFSMTPQQYRKNANFRENRK